MKKLIIVVLVLLLCAGIEANAADADSVKHILSHHVGAGLGLPYGGIGGRYVFSPINSLSLTAGVGYNLLDVGYNVGIIGSLPLASRLRGYLFGMFGTNAVIRVEGAANTSESYTGFSLAVGVNLMSKGKTAGYWDFGIIVPFRSSQFNDDWDDIKNSGLYQVKIDPWPVLLTVGYNFKL